MSVTKISWGRGNSTDEPSGPHFDARRNWDYAKDFYKIKKWLCGMANGDWWGMKMEFPLSKDIAFSHVVVAWLPPKDAKAGNHAYPVSCHQSADLFMNDLENAYLRHFRMAQAFIEKSTYKQHNFLDVVK